MGHNIYWVPIQYFDISGFCICWKRMEEHVQTSLYLSIELRATGTESHNSLGQGETYLLILRLVYNKVSLTHPDLPSELRLALAVKAMNYTAGPHGLVPSLFLFGVIFRDSRRRSNLS
jgi:hypothetical protein